MLIKFKAQNIYSFSPESPCELSLVAGKQQEKKEFIVENKDTKLRLLRLGLIYGKNAAGKTNLLKSLYFLGETMIKGVPPEESFHIPQFKFDSQKETRFEIAVLTSCGELRYLLTLNPDSVVQEELFHRPNTSPEKLVFKRTGNQIELGKSSKTIPAEMKNFILATAGRARANQLFLNKLMDDNFQQFKQETSAQPYLDLWEWFRRANFVAPHSIFKKREFIAENMTLFISKFLKKINMDVQVKVVHSPVTDSLTKERFEKLKSGQSMLLRNDSNMSYVKRESDGTLNRYEIQFERNGQTFTMAEESAGIKRLVELIPILFFSKMGSFTTNKALDKKIYQTVFIDELGVRFHRDLLEAFIREFAESYKQQPFIQMICTTHDEHLLNLVRRDCVSIIKMDNNETILEEFKARKDGSFRHAWEKQLQNKIQS